MSCSYLSPSLSLKVSFFLDPLFYDVYTHLSELHLSDVGVDVAWSDVDVTSTSEETTKDRWGDTREYFTLPVYRLPIGQMRC